MASPLHFHALESRLTRTPLGRSLLVSVPLLVTVILLTLTPHVAAQDSAMARQFLDTLNAVRADPASFIPTVDAFVREWRSFVPDSKKLEKAAEEIKRELKKQKPLPAFVIDTGLVAAAQDHAEDGRRMGVLGHIGSDKSNPADRVKRHTAMSQVSEVITYGQATAAYMLAAFLIDEQDPKRGHRKSLLSTQLTLIGVAVDTHPKYRILCIAVLGTR